jgi:hypothetical protein
LGKNGNKHQKQFSDGGKKHQKSLVTVPERHFKIWENMVTSIKRSLVTVPERNFSK